MEHTIERRNSFGTIAEQYDLARPGYPADLIRDLITTTGIPDSGSILEVGSGTGKATQPLATQGYQMTCIELSQEMADVAQKKFDASKNVAIHVGKFETFPLQDATFDVFFSATAFHWIDPKTRYQRAAQALNPSGSIALCWNSHCWVAESQGFFEAVQSVYRKVVPEMARKYEGLLQRAKDIPRPEVEALPQSGYFEDVRAYSYPWMLAYSTEQYIDLLGTYSDHSTLPPETKLVLLEGIADMIEDQFGGSVVKGYLSVLYVADVIKEYK